MDIKFLVKKLPYLILLKIDCRPSLEIRLFMRLFRKDNTFKEFVVDCMDLPPCKNAFIPGKCGGIFGNQDLKFRMLALRLDFDL